MARRRHRRNPTHKGVLLLGALAAGGLYLHHQAGLDAAAKVPAVGTIAPDGSATVSGSADGGAWAVQGQISPSRISARWSETIPHSQ